MLRVIGLWLLSLDHRVPTMEVSRILLVQRIHHGPSLNMEWFVGHLLMERNVRANPICHYGGSSLLVELQGLHRCLVAPQRTVGSLAVLLLR